MPMKNQHVVPFANGWAVCPENSQRLKSLAYYKEDAIKYGWREALRGKVDLVIHDREGNIESVRSTRKKRKPRT